ncbi:guanine nucleotide-binding protein alpha subunit [Mycena filopes]|nr:guanine nucleotide-binding protein alpha subunit [Mycena filopes]
MPTRTHAPGLTHKSQLSDPLAHALRPPPDESPSARTARLALEAEQKRVSDAIDDALSRERAERKKRARREVRVLLLGQSESGKSTVLKNFRLKYAPQQWKAELRSWRAVIQLNLIQNVVTILDALAPFLDSPGSMPTSEHPRTSLDSHLPTNADGNANGIALGQTHRLLHMRLSPLREVGDDLRRRLGGDNPPEFANSLSTSSPLSSSALPSLALDTEEAPRPQQREFGVRGWIGALGLASPANSKSQLGEGEEDVDSATQILASLAPDIAALWADDGVRALLGREGVRVEDWAGFFLPDTPRITARNYVPTDNDVVRARLRTVGVQEWRVCLEGGSDHFGAEWLIYDVGGSRSMRHAWLPYFDTVNAIIFLAPLSPFDERLLEDPAVNRLEDTLLLWRAIVQSPLVGRRVALVVFLNKCDLLKRKLQSGVQVRKHLISFGDRENEVGVVVKYLKDKFKDILRADAAHPRTTYLYATSVTDTKATAATLAIVRDGIIREHLKHAEFV